MLRARRATIALTLACLACCAALGAGLAAAEEPKIDYVPESYGTYQQQLASGQIQAVTINKRLRSLRVTLKNGKYVLAKYQAHEEPKVAAALEAKGVTPTILQPATALKEAQSKPKHHKLRYIVGGVLIVVIVVVGAVLLIDRRRKLAAE